MRYFVGFLVTIGLLITLLVLLFTGGQGNKGGKAGKAGNPLISARPQTTDQLVAYSDTAAVVRLIIDGQINSNQTHQAIRITVGKDDVTYEQIQGYEGTVVNRQDFANNQSAYTNFLYALGRAGFTRGDSNSKLANEKGFCALGQRYIFELLDGDHTIQRYWATSCGGGAPKTYKGGLALTLNLFELQLPDYGGLTRDVQLQQ